jgi:hypothetical protein
LCVESDPMFVAQGQFAILTWLLTRSAEWAFPNARAQCSDYKHVSGSKSPKFSFVYETRFGKHKVYI